MDGGKRVREIEKEREWEREREGGGEGRKRQVRNNFGNSFAVEVHLQPRFYLSLSLSLPPFLSLLPSPSPLSLSPFHPMLLSSFEKWKSINVFVSEETQEIKLKSLRRRKILKRNKLWINFPLTESCIGPSGQLSSHSFITGMTYTINTTMFKR